MHHHTLRIEKKKKKNCTDFICTVLMLCTTKLSRWRPFLGRRGFNWSRRSYFHSNSGIRCLTVLNPSRPLKSYINQYLKTLDRHQFRTATVIVACTQTYTDDIYRFATAKDDKEDLQKIAFAVDSIPYGAQKKGFSCMFLEDEVKVCDPLPIGCPEFQGDPMNLAGETIHGNTSGKETWKASSSYVSIAYKPNGDIIFPAANTLFSSGTESVIIHNSLDSRTCPGMLLSSVKLVFPNSIKFASISSFAPLKSIGESNLTVTSSVNNMIKTIDGKPAASFLESVREIMDPSELEGNRPPKIFAQITSSTSSYRYEVVAGGGGSWSPRSSMLVLEPQATVLQGDRISFSLARPITGPHSYSNYGITEKCQDLEKDKCSKIVFECTPICESIHEPDLIEYSTDHLIFDTFGIGTENGILVNDIKHSVSGEVTVLPVSENL